jgi:succinoglycan biosynthesis protein ExoA
VRSGPLPPLPSDASVSVVVPAHRSAETIEVALDAVLAQDPPVGEVVVAVGPSTDGTAALVAAIARQDPRVRLVHNPSGRTPDALNAAIAATDGQIVVRVDAHAVLPPGYVRRAVATLRETGAANVGGRQIPVGETAFGRAVAAAMRSPLGAGGAAYRTGTTPGPVDTVYLGVFRREALADVGAFDPRFARNQDAELNHRLRRAGHAVWFDPDLEVVYRPRSTVRGLASQYFQYGRWRRLTGRVHPGSLAPRQLAAPALVVLLGGAAGASAITRDLRPFAIVAGSYLLAVAGAGVHAAGARDGLPAAVALATMHLSWGIGFLVGPPRRIPPGSSPVGGSVTETDG